jgi:hypothetical protein
MLLADDRDGRATFWQRIDFSTNRETPIRQFDREAFHDFGKFSSAARLFAG